MLPTLSAKVQLAQGLIGNSGGYQVKSKYSG